MDCLKLERTSREATHKCLKMVSQEDNQYNTSKFITADFEGFGQCLRLYSLGEAEASNLWLTACQLGMTLRQSFKIKFCRKSYSFKV